MFIELYVPIFHDCRTFACSVQAAAEGYSSLACYLLFKGYWLLRRPRHRGRFHTFGRLTALAVELEIGAMQ